MSALVGVALRPWTERCRALTLLREVNRQDAEDAKIRVERGREFSAICPAAILRLHSPAFGDLGALAVQTPLDLRSFPDVSQYPQ
jgi:hypothetical protein